MMRTRAVAVEKPLEVTVINLEGPKRGEVLIEVKATGLCLVIRVNPSAPYL